MKSEGGVDCGFTSPTSAVALRVAGTTLGCVGVRREYPWPILTISWPDREDNPGHVKKVPETGPMYTSCVWGLQSLKVTQVPSHSTRPQLRRLHVQPSTLNLSQNLSPAREPQTVQTLEPWDIPHWDSTPATIITPLEPLAPQDKWFDNCHKWKIGW